ncbi:MAG: hypothetical protein GX557_11180 [Chloroflexi bacterium]|nr:hypothetical protein [Chloroflexota bacterium]
MFESSPYDRTTGAGPLGVLAVGYVDTRVRTLLSQAVQGAPAALGLTSAWPLPEQALQGWLAQRARVLVLEEGGPFVEEAVRGLAQRAALPVTIHGRNDRVVPEEDELTDADLVAALNGLQPALGLASPSRAPGLRLADKPLCADCLYWPVMQTLLEAVGAHGGRSRHLIIGEPGCMVRAMQPPLKLFDVKYSMGAGLGLATGLALQQRDRHVIALLGDSSTLHSGMNALPQAVQLDPRLLLIVLANETTGLTGGQPHMGSRIDERGQPRDRADLARLFAGMGITPAECAAYDTVRLRGLLDEALAHRGLRAIIAHAPCPRFVEPGTAKQ